jgi:hypothetical protein
MRDQRQVGLDFGMRASSERQVPEIVTQIVSCLTFADFHCYGARRATSLNLEDFPVSPV